MCYVCCFDDSLCCLGVSIISSVFYEVTYTHDVRCVFVRLFGCIFVSVSVCSWKNDGTLRTKNWSTCITLSEKECTVYIVGSVSSYSHTRTFAREEVGW